MRQSVEAFVKKLESVYERYRPAVRQEVLDWAGQYKDDTLAGIYQAVRESFSNQYNHPPDIAVLKKAYTEYRESMMVSIDDFLALPDPDYEARKRELTDEEREKGAEFMRRLLDGMKWGVHPTEILKEWESENEVR